MSTTARKARKRAGIKFVKAAKIGTPQGARAPRMVFDRNGATAGVQVQHASNRYAKQIKRRIDAINGKLRWAK